MAQAQVPTSSLHGRTKHDVDLLWHSLRGRIDPWLMGFMSQHGIAIQRHDGRPIDLKGMGFQGSPQAVFWGGYIEPFLKEGIIEVLEETLARCREAEMDARPCLIEARAMLAGLVGNTYRLMADVDYKLLTANHQLMANPPVVERRSTGEYVARMESFLDAQLQAILAQQGTIVHRMKLFIANHPFLAYAALLLCVLGWTCDHFDLVKQLWAWLYPVR